jgi:hypothetical protein
MRKIKSGWSSNMEQRAAREDRQVKCLIASSGHLWMRGYFDRLPPPVRRRLRESVFNICPACLQEEAQKAAQAHRLTRPSTEIYLRMIAAIERKLRDA